MKNIILLIVFLVTFFLLFSSVFAIQLKDNLYFSMEPDSRKTVDISLPDDAGVILPGKVEYIIKVEPVFDSWSELSYQVVRTDENNTAIIPMVFSTINRETGNCSEPYLLTISVPYFGLEKRFTGGVCVSKHPDVDTGNIGDNPGDNPDIFDIAFKRSMKISKPNESIKYELLMESYANITLDLKVQGDLVVTPSKKNIKLNSENPKKSLNLTVRAPGKIGNYNFSILSKIIDCEKLCTKIVHGSLIVKEDVPDQASFSLSVFPNSISVKELEPVLFEVTIFNNGKRNTFDLDIETELDTTFKKTSLVIDEKTEKTLEFTVTPENAVKLYEIKFTAKADSLTKHATSYMSTNEMMTDAMINKDIVDFLSEGENTETVQNEMDSWYNKYKNLEYGEDIKDYEDLKNVIDKSKSKTDTYIINGEDNNGSNEHEEIPKTNFLDNIWLIIIPVIVIVVVILLFLIQRKKSVLEEEI